MILDLGANAGYAAAHYASLYPHARIIAVELDEGNAALARRNLEPFANVELVHAGVWIENGEMTYGGTQADAFTIGEGEKRASTLTIETLLEERGLKSADYVKLDVEGAEWPLFQHPSWLGRVKSLGVEVHRPEWFEPITAELERHGFEVAKSGAHWSLVTAWRRVQ